MTPSDFLNIFPEFRQSGRVLIENILQSAAMRTIPAETRIYTEGDSCNAIAFILSGEIRIYRISELGREITLYEIGRGESCILNASCIISGSNYPAHAVSLTAVDMLLVPAATFRKLLDEHSPMRTFIFGLLSKRLASVMELVDEVAFRRMDERLSEYLLEKAANGRLERTHQQIANDLGTSREVVSRLLKDLERKGRVVISRSAVNLVDN
jgi:CRP/FNR family transcriptional regulator